LLFYVPSAVAAVRPHVELATDSSGRVVAAIGGGKAERAAVVRLRPDGQLDASFSADGMIGPRPSEERVALALQPSGRVVVAMRVGRGRVLLHRYLVNGRPDRSFGKRGVVRIGVVPTNRLLAQPDGHLVTLIEWLCSARSCGYEYRYLEIRRYGPNGRSVSRHTYGNQNWEYEAAGSDARGGILVAGQDFGLGIYAFARLRPSGRIDPSLGGRDGFQVPEGEGYAPKVSDIAIQPGGSFVIAVDEASTELRRRNRHGLIDKGFGSDGAAVCAPETLFPRLSTKPFVAVEPLPDGSLIAAGGRGPCGLARYLPNGTPDPAFGTEGRVDLEALGLPRPVALSIGPTGKIALAGWDPATQTVKIASVTPDGRLDLGFGTAGSVSLSGF
jgi:uncharacterized delta-60 repeat protein